MGQFSVKKFSSIANLDFSDIQNAIVEVKLTNLTPLSSIDISNKQIKDLFPNAMSVSIKREFKQSDDSNSISNMEAISLEEYFLEHIKEGSDEKEFDRLKSKIQELFANYEEIEDDIN